jgi:predicted ATPase
VIRSLTLINFKAFADVTVPLGRFTLLSGLNSSGKSTVLQALALLRQAYDSDPDLSGSGGEQPRLPLNGEYVQLGIGQDVLHDGYQGEPGIGFDLELDDGSHAHLRASYRREEDTLPASGNFGTAGWLSEALSLVQPGFQFLRADRINPAVTYARSYEMSARRAFLGTRGEFTVDFLRQHGDEPMVDAALKHPSVDSPQLLPQVDAWLGEICPGVRISADAIDNTDLVRLGIQLSTPGQPISAVRRPTNVGFGITYVLPIIVACLTARPGSLVLLENPEAHVHPRGQSAMARLTCAAAAVGAQVVVETHSDHVLNGVRLVVKTGGLAGEDIRLHYFHRPDGMAVNLVSPVIDRDGMLSDWPAGFFDEWDLTLDRLLG